MFRGLIKLFLINKLFGGRGGATGGRRRGMGCGCIGIVVIVVVVLLALFLLRGCEGGMAGTGYEF